jgi:hypothetical protein
MDAMLHRNKSISHGTREEREVGAGYQFHDHCCGSNDISYASYVCTI